MPERGRTWRRRRGRLVDRLRAGDQRAWAAWYDEVAPIVRGYARARGAVDPDDTVGDTFAAAAARIGTFDGDDTQLRSWLFTIAHHRLADDQRRQRVRRGTSSVDPEDLVGIADPVEVDLEGRLDAAGALALLDLLTPDQRDVVALRVLGGLSVEETAAVVGRDGGAVKALQHRALARIRRLAEDPSARRVELDEHP